MADIKVELAMAFINSIRQQVPRELNDKIVAEVGDNLAQFFHNYSANLIATCEGPYDAVERCSALMLMGYLIRINEEKAGVDTVTQQLGVA